MKGNVHITRWIVHCKGTVSGWAQIGQHISPKNIISHLPHPAGHQTKLDMVEFVFVDFDLKKKDGTNTVGRTMNGQSNGVWNNLKLSFFKEVVRATKRLVPADSKRQAQSCHQQPESLTACLVLSKIDSVLTELPNLSFALSQWQQPVSATEERRHQNYLYASRRTFFSCASHSAQFIQNCTSSCVGTPHWLKVKKGVCVLWPSALVFSFSSRPCSHLDARLPGPLRPLPRLVPVGQNPGASAHKSGMSGCHGNPTPNRHTRKRISVRRESIWELQKGFWMGGRAACAWPASGKVWSSEGLLEKALVGGSTGWTELLWLPRVIQDVLIVG